MFLPIVTVNSKDLFVWGIYNGFLIKAEHVFVFEPINDSKGTHLIHYEKMTGMLSPFIMTKKMKVTMTEHYNIMNQDLKKLCENKIDKPVIGFKAAGTGIPLIKKFKEKEPFYASVYKKNFLKNKKIISILENH